MKNNDYKKLCDRLYSWLNDMRWSLAPDEFVTDDEERQDRLLQVELLDSIMEWMDEQVNKQ